MGEHFASRVEQLQQNGCSIGPSGGYRSQRGPYRTVRCTPDTTHLNRLARQGWQNVNVGCALELLGYRANSDIKSTVSAFDAVANIAQTVVVRRNGDGHISRAASDRVRRVPGVIVYPDV